ncbi:MAG: pantetheine-phosphate adenylyltransferase [Clostridiales bacterium]|nr:pantetheine-phosphate adenylyltransferase [Clostridiales bacterium]
MKKCVFAGTFDPVTLGHKKVIDTALKIFDEVVVAVLINTAKSPLFTLDERLSFLNKLYNGDKRVKIISFKGAVVDLLEQENTPYYVRGIRNTVDFEYENQNHFANKKLKEDIVTIYLPAEQDSLQISSSLVKNSIIFNKEYSFYVPEQIYTDIQKVLEEKDV